MQILCEIYGIGFLFAVGLVLWVIGLYFKYLLDGHGLYCGLMLYLIRILSHSFQMWLVLTRTVYVKP